MRRTILRFTVALALLLGSALAQTVTFDGKTYGPDDPLPPDPDLQVLRLENGLTLFLLPNSEPENRVVYGLAVRAGSLVEEDDERGLAHFLEHMAFNGTERFPGQGVRDFLEKTGMKFGPDINAYTSWTETVFTLEVPADAEELLQKAAMVMADWAQRITFDPEEIEKERGVVVEEDRLRLKNLNGRLMEVIVPAYFGDSRYAQRLPIGDMEVIGRARREDFVDFYRRWYRPELMAVVAVGDADAQLLADQLQGELGPLAARGGPALPEVPPPLGNGPVYKVFSDPEMPVVVGLITFKAAPLRLKTVGDYRDGLERELFVAMVAERFQELLHSPGAPFQQVQFQRSELAGIDFYELTLVSSAETIEKAFKAAASELERIRSQGFDEAALERAKRDLTRRLEENYDKRNDTESALLRQGLVSSYLQGVPFTSAEWDYQVGRQLLATITLDRLEARGRLFGDAGNRIAVVLGPEQVKQQLPTENEVAAWFGSATAAPASDRRRATIERLMEPPAPAGVTAEGQVPELDLRWFSLENGVKVWVKLTDFVADEVLFEAASWGGASLLPDQDYLEAVFAPQLVAEAGLGEYDRVTLDRFLAGHNVSLQTSIDDETERLSGSTDADDLETLFQLVHLHFARTRQDEDAAQRVIDRIATTLENRRNHPDAVFIDAIQKLIYGDRPRYRVPAPEEVRALDPARAFEIYRQRFGNAADFGFVFVGDLDYDRLKELAARYLGSLPTRPKRERYRDRLPPLPADPKPLVINKGLEDQARVWRAHLGEQPLFFERKNRVAFAVLANLLQIDLIDTVREEASGSYAPQLLASYKLYPRPRFRLGFTFTASPDRLDGLVRQAEGLLAALAEKGPDGATLDKAKAQWARDWEDAQKDNGFWTRLLLEGYVLAYKPNPPGVRQAPAMAQALQPEDLQALARTLLAAPAFEVRRLPEAR